MSSVRQRLGTPAEVAEYLGIPVATLAQWRHMGSGPDFRKVGKHVRYVWVEVDHWLAERRYGDRRSAV